jgi:hypothetical protein
LWALSWIPILSGILGPLKKKMIKRKKEIKLPKKVKQDAHFHHIHVSTIVAVLF